MIKPFCLPILLGFLISALLSGCSGTATSLPRSGNGTPYDQLGSRSRYLHDSDKWFYTFQATLTTDGVDQNFTGQVQQLLDAAIINGTQYRSLAQIFVLDTPQGSSISSNATYFQQDPVTRKITNFGINESGAIRFFATPQTPLIDKGVVGESNSRISTFEDGSSVEESVRVVGNELITVPAGKFMTYKTDSTQKANGRESHYTTWYSYQLGSYVRSEDTTTLPSGQTVHRVMELLSTNVIPED